MPVMASTSLVFRRMKAILPGRRRGRDARATPGATSTSGVALRGRARGGRSPIFLELIMQGFQAYAEDFSGPRLVVIGGFQGLHDELPFGFLHRGAHSQMQSIGIHGGSARRSMAESRGQVLGFDDGSLADNDRALQRIAQFAHISR